MSHKQKHEQPRSGHNRSPNTLMKIGAVIGASLLVGGVAESQRHDTASVPEIVRPYDSPWSLVRRADKDAGVDPDNVDMRPAVDRIVENYGTVLQPGKKIIVKIDK